MYYGDISREYNMRKQLLTALAASILALAFTISSASAQGTVRVRGTIEKVEGNAFVVKSRDGRELKVVPADNALVVAIVKASPADIKQGSFVGVTGMPQADGSQRAIEVHIFPEAMRGTGEGHRPWDLRPQSTMTNAKRRADRHRGRGADAYPEVQGWGEKDRRPAGYPD